LDDIKCITPYRVVVVVVIIAVPIAVEAKEKDIYDCI